MDTYSDHNFNDGASLLQNNSVQCTSEQLRKAGYKPSPPVASSYRTDARGNLIDPNPLEQKRTAKTVTHTANISICCLEPPSVGSVASLTVVEKYRERPPPLPPLEETKSIPPPPTPPPLILRERPPLPPPTLPHHEECVVYLDPPPLPRTVITHVCKKPPKPRDIIIERWLPYKIVLPKNVDVKRASPPPEPILHNTIVIHEPQVNIKHQIREHGPILTDPVAYEQKYGDQLLSESNIKEQLFALLNEQGADENIRQRLQYMCRGPLDPNPGPCKGGFHSNTPPPPHQFPSNIPSPCDEIFSNIPHPPNGFFSNIPPPPHQFPSNIPPPPHQFPSNIPPPPHQFPSNIPPPPHQFPSNIPPPPHQFPSNIPPPPHQFPSNNPLPFNGFNVSHGNGVIYNQNPCDYMFRNSYY